MRTFALSIAVTALFALSGASSFAHTDNDTLANLKSVSLDVTVAGDDNGLSETDIASHVQDSLKAANITVDPSSKHVLGVYINSLNATAHPITGYHVEVHLLEACTVARGETQTSGITADTWVDSRLGMVGTDELKDNVIEDLDASVKEFTDDYTADNPAPSVAGLKSKALAPKSVIAGQHSVHSAVKKVS